MDFILSNVKNVCFPLFNPGLHWALCCLGATKINYISLVMQMSFKFPLSRAHFGIMRFCCILVLIKFTKGLSCFYKMFLLEEFVCLYFGPLGILLKLKKRLDRASVV